MKSKLSEKGKAILAAGSVQIGRYSLSAWTEKSIYIQDDATNDAGEFNIEKLEKVIKKFFEKEF